MLKSFLQSRPENELSKGLGTPKKGNNKAKDINFECSGCGNIVHLSRMAKQTGKGAMHAAASPIYGGIGVSLLGPFGVFLGFALGGYASVRSFQKMGFIRTGIKNNLIRFALKIL